MKLAITPILFAALILTSSQTFAADPMPSDSMSSSSMTAAQQSMMKDCMAKQKAKDSSRSKDDMKKACMDKMKMTPHMDPSTGDQLNPTAEGQPSPATGKETTPPK
jgi:pentapeptide MXKDX repeat protein